MNRRSGRLAARTAALFALAAALLLAFSAAAFADPATTLDQPAAEEAPSEQQEQEQAHGDEESGSVNEVTVGHLNSVDVALNGETIRVTGEVVGQPIMADGGHVWLQIDDENGTGIAVFMRASQAEQIKYYGNYDTTGDTIAVTGIYHVDCPSHQGDLDVHAVDVAVTVAGGPIEHGEGAPLGLAIGLVAAGAVAGVVYWRLREHMR